MRRLAYLAALLLIAAGVALVVARPADRVGQGDVVPADCPGCTPIPRSVP